MSSGSESACCSSMLSSEYKLTEFTSGATGSRLPMRKKRKIASGRAGKLKASGDCHSLLPLAQRGIDLSTVNCSVVISV